MGSLLETLLGIAVVATVLNVFERSMVFAWEGPAEVKHRVIPKGGVNFWS